MGKGCRRSGPRLASDLWRAGCIERCTSGSGRDHRQPIEDGLRWSSSTPQVAGSSPAAPARDQVGARQEHQPFFCFDPPPLVARQAIWPQLAPLIYRSPAAAASLGPSFTHCPISSRYGIIGNRATCQTARKGSRKGQRASQARPAQSRQSRRAAQQRGRAEDSRQSHLLPPSLSCLAPFAARRPGLATWLPAESAPGSAGRYSGRSLNREIDKGRFSIVKGCSCEQRRETSTDCRLSGQF